MKKSCLLGDEICNLAGTDKCHNLCPTYIQLHGKSGLGGRVNSSQTPSAHHLFHINNSPVRESQKENYLIFAKYINRIFNPRNHVEKRLSLYLYSKNPGTGKTVSASSLVHTYIIKSYFKSLQSGNTPELMPAFFLDANYWQTKYNEATRPHVPREIAEDAFHVYYTLKKKAEAAPLLAIDDLAVRSITEGHRTDLHELINNRITSNLPTIYTSNLHPEELDDVFGERRLADRIKDKTMVITFKGESNRKL